MMKMVAEDVTFLGSSGNVECMKNEFGQHGNNCIWIGLYSYDLMAVVVKAEAEEEEEGDLITVVNEMKISWYTVYNNTQTQTISDTKEAHGNGHVLDDILLSDPEDGRISYEEFQTTMKAGTEWRKASLVSGRSECRRVVSGHVSYKLQRKKHTLEKMADDKCTKCVEIEYQIVAVCVVAYHSIAVLLRNCKRRFLIRLSDGKRNECRQKRRGQHKRLNLNEEHEMLVNQSLVMAAKAASIIMFFTEDEGKEQRWGLDNHQRSKRKVNRNEWSMEL
ncbi:hypothetical protein Tco_0936770 [Tanacetum coccineum]|uniref:EF-hand domain-containing protein n=1 Tax=Tanacetum coccineum TaxID=301880 RepID=A0ABQ5DCB8_9ASTR